MVIQLQLSLSRGCQEMMNGHSVKRAVSPVGRLAIRKSTLVEFSQTSCEKSEAKASDTSAGYTQQVESAARQVLASLRERGGGAKGPEALGWQTSCQPRSRRTSLRSAPACWVAPSLREGAIPPAELLFPLYIPTLMRGQFLGGPYVTYVLG